MCMLKSVKVYWLHRMLHWAVVSFKHSARHACSFTLYCRIPFGMLIQYFRVLLQMQIPVSRQRVELAHGKWQMANGNCIWSQSRYFNYINEYNIPTNNEFGAGWVFPISVSAIYYRKRAASQYRIGLWWQSKSMAF